MVQIMENKFAFDNRAVEIYCGNCKTEMSFNGHGFECPICGAFYREKASA